MAPEEHLSQLSLCMVTLCHKSDTFCLYFVLWLRIQIQIHKDPASLCSQMNKLY